jgi:hypothetical protein
MAQEEIDKMRDVGREQKQRQGDQVQRNQLQADVIGHVQREDLNQCSQADHRAERRGARRQQQHAGEHLYASREDLVWLGGPDRGP